MYIKVWANPGSKREIVEKVNDYTFEISVKEPAEGNRANTRIIELLALEFHITPKQVRFISGHQSGSKMFSVPDL